MAGSISLSLSQQFDELGEPLSGGLLQFYAAGTTTPQSAYQDVALTLPYPNPIELDSAGRIPPFYLADGQIKIVLKNASGVIQVEADNLLVIGASSGTATPPSVDATTVLQTGALMPFYGTGARTGFVRPNGRSIGSASSGASESASADCEDLFIHLYTADASLTVLPGGRGASAAADWAANKTIALPDFRGRVIAALDDMGSTAAGRLTSTYFGTSAVVLGAAGGGESQTLATANLPAYTPAGTNGSISVGSGGNQIPISTGAISEIFVSSSGANRVPVTGGTWSNPTALTGSGPTFTGTAQGGTSAAFRTAQPTMLITIYIKK